VIDGAGRLAGTLGLRELALRGDGAIAQVMSTARTAMADEPVLSLVETLSDGYTHAVVVTAEDRSVLGIVTQTDLLAVLMRMVSAKALEPAGPQTS
jgi:CBS domain-containing membrane protein